MDRSDLLHRFIYHPPPNDAVAEQHAAARAAVLACAEQVNDLTVVGREQSLAVTKLEEALFWTNAAIARARERGGAHD